MLFPHEVLPVGAKTVGCGHAVAARSVAGGVCPMASRGAGPALAECRAGLARRAAAASGKAR